MAKYQHCFIITYGRSGSTLLQAVLNSIPGYVIRGENGGLLTHIHRMLAVVEGLQVDKGMGRHAADSPSHPWYGFADVDPRALLRALGDVFTGEVLRPPAGSVCVGFKEIRYGLAEVSDLSAMLRHMTEMFDRSCFVYNSRNLEDVANSGWWAESPKALNHLGRFEERMREAYASDIAPSHWVYYDEYTKSPEALKPLFDFLGEGYDDESVRGVLGKRQGYGRWRPEIAGKVETA